MKRYIFRSQKWVDEVAQVRPDIMERVVTNEAQVSIVRAWYETLASDGNAATLMERDESALRQAIINEWTPSEERTVCLLMDVQ